MSTDKFAGHTPGPKEAEYFHGYFQVLKRNAGDLVAKFVSDADAELFIAAPELLAENERLNARINSLGDELEMMAYKLATDAYLIARVEI